MRVSCERSSVYRTPVSYPRSRAREVPSVALDDANDDAKDAERRPEDLDDEDLHEERRVLRIGERTATAGDADTNPEQERAAVGWGQQSTQVPQSTPTRFQG